MQASRRHGVTRSVITSLGLALLLAVGGAGAGAALAADPDPVLLVHGYRGDPSTWADMIARFAAEGRTAVAIDLPSEDNTVNAARIRDFIADKGWGRVDLVAQSMGGLSARHFVKFLKSSARIDSYVSLGTPQYGIYAACVLPRTYGGQMCPSSSFLRDLNRKDDTPRRRRLDDDLQHGRRVRPELGVTPRRRGVPRPGLGCRHNDMDNDAGIFAHVLAAVDGTCTGEMR